MFAERNFKKGEALLFYVGELLSGEEGRAREKRYTLEDGSFIYYFIHNGSSWW